jgi:hypothetical protein
MNMSEMLMDDIEAAGISVEEANGGLVIQCFSLTALAEFSGVMRERGYDIPLVWLVDCKQGLPDESELKNLSKLASRVGVGCAAAFLLPPASVRCISV